MMELFISGGMQFMIPISLLAILSIMLISKKAYDLFVKKDAPTDSLKTGLHAILFTGSLCFAWGMLGQTMGIYQMLQYISGSTQEVKPHIIAGGLQISMIPTAYGLIIFMISSLCWFVLLGRYKQLSKSNHIRQ
ncbi:MotA/TolQ/ExbB proton channel family protein [Rhodocytophaga rosea]|uniref:MotA/TolQ/ExbB proton channel family protein n=1 Tax=Rhodocytophaga rosea TaxID=2704465 RepID=A0A6C0GN45_9BACT|nr:MotA/TolQ/ExbB proton channel family protein [Rhodocytophaga rosea]QHT69456.1 MotA/TolQ/ExbB proton channel family protein [Rhodocytophaga rosea]